MELRLHGAGIAKLRGWLDFLSSVLGEGFVFKAVGNFHFKQDPKPTKRAAMPMELIIPHLSGAFRVI